MQMQIHPTSTIYIAADHRRMAYVQCMADIAGGGVSEVHLFKRKFT